MENEDITNLTEKFLQLENYETITCSNGYDALDIIKEKHNEIALVLLDILLPSMSGYDILAEIKSKYPKILVILYTAKNFFEDIQKGKELGADGYLLLKGFNDDDKLINNLIKSVNLKDDQIKTMIDAINLKEQQINRLSKSLEIKNQKIKALETSINLKEEEVKELKSSTVKKDLLAEKDEEIEEYQKKLTILKGELEKADEILEALEIENERLRKYLASKAEAKIIDSTFMVIPKSEILKKIREILGNAVHYVTIVVPDINDLQDLHLYEVRFSVNLKIMCNFDPSLEEDAKLLAELESLDNITIRLYEDRDRFLIDRDGEELLFSIVGSSEDNNLVIYTKDPKHLAKKSKFDGDDRFPFPFIFKPPKPPGDLALAGRAQLRHPPKKKESEIKIACQYCGMELTKEDHLTHSCKKKPKKT